MPTYYNPTTSYAAGGLDRETGQNMPAALWQRLMDTLAHIAGTTGSVSAHVYHSADQSVLSGGEAIVAFNSERHDTEGFHDNAVNNSRLTIPAGHAGKYIAAATLGYAANATGRRQLGIKKNGTVYVALVTLPTQTDGTGWTMTVVTPVLDLVAGDYLEVAVYQTSGGALMVSALSQYSPEFGIAKV